MMPVLLMPIQVIEPCRLYLQIADRIRSLIAGGAFPPGIRVERRVAERNTSTIKGIYVIPHHLPA